MFHISWLHVVRLHQTFLTNVSLNFRSFLARIPFLWKWVHFRLVFCRTLPNVYSPKDCGIPAFTITLLLQKRFPSFLASTWYVVRYFSFMKQAVSAVFPDYFFSYACWWLLLDTSSMILYLIFLNKIFLHLDADSAS